VGVFTQKPSDSRIIISRPQVIGSGFLVKILAAIAEGVVIVGVRVYLVAKCVVIVLLAEKGRIPPTL